MSNANHTLAFRPLLAGVGIYNPIVNEVGTLGLIATSDGADRWIVSCYHVLVRNAPSAGAVPLSAGEVIFQGSAHDGPVARTDPARADVALDCAAALIERGLAERQAILDVGILNPTPVAVSAGMRVIKAGAETGVTEGVISRVDVGQVLIAPPPGHPSAYSVAGRGDSGALWVTMDTHQAVALHLGVRTIDGMAVARPIGPVLANLRLNFP